MIPAVNIHQNIS